MHHLNSKFSCFMSFKIEPSSTKKKLVFSPTMFKTIDSQYDTGGSI